MVHGIPDQQLLQAIPFLLCLLHINSLGCANDAGPASPATHYIYESVLTLLIREVLYRCLLIYSSSEKTLAVP